MFRILRIPRLVKVTAFLTFFTLSGHHYYCQNSQFKFINEKDVNAHIQNPQIYSNTIIVLNPEVIDHLPSSLQVKLCLYKESEQNEILKEYDIIAINQFRCMFIKFRGDEDYLRLLNFYKSLEILQTKEQAISLIKATEGKIVLSYVPYQNVNKPTFSEPINELDQFKKKGEKDLNQLEEQFRELRYLDYNREVQYYLIRDQQCAEEFNLSNNDIGEIYVLKKSTKFTAQESAFIYEGNEYNLQKVEPDPNLEEPDYFKNKEIQSSYQTDVSKFLNLPFEAQPVGGNSLNLNKIVNRVSLLSQSYVNNVYNRQQMDSQLLLAKQMGIRYLLVFIANGEENEKSIKKLVNFKRSLNTHQQSEMMIIFSENAEIFQQYFGISQNYQRETIRLLDLEGKQKDNYQFQFVGVNEQNFQKNDHQYQYQYCSRYLFDDKLTIGRLKQFVKKVNNKQLNEHFEQNELKYPLVQFKTITSNHLDLGDFDLIQFYKPGCAACHKLSESLEIGSFDLKHPTKQHIRNRMNFDRIQFKRYNIFNESPRFPSPRQAPLIVGIKNGKLSSADLIKQRVNPADSERLINFLSKFIDSLV